jgi:hypothetical protein
MRVLVGKILFRNGELNLLLRTVDARCRRGRDDDAF